MLTTILSTVSAFIVLFSGNSIPYGNTVLSEANYSLSNRYSDQQVNDVFKDNILLTLAYMSGKAKKGQPVYWDKIKESGSSAFVLKSGETFAFHDSVLPKYKAMTTVTTNAHFDSSEGFKSDGWLIGDGVCHLASFINALTIKAGLQSEAPTKHDFATIPDVPKEMGVSIYYLPDDPNLSTLQNLYVTNNSDKTVAYIFTYDNDILHIKIEQL